MVKSPKNISTPIPWGTLEYAKNALEGCTNYAETLRVQTLVFKILDGSTRIYEKQTRGVDKSPKNNSTPVPWSTPEYAKKRSRGVHKLRRNISIPITGGTNRIYDKQTRGVDQWTKNNSTPVPWSTPEYAKNAPEGCTNYAEILVFQFLMEAPEYTKNKPEVDKSTKNNSTPIPWGTPVYAKNKPEGFTNYSETLVCQYLVGAPEYTKNAPEGWTNRRKTIVHRYHAARQNMRKTHQRVAQITQKH